MLKIRLSRVGKKKQASFRLVVSDSKKDLWGGYLENLGNYDPQTKKKIFKADRIKHWLGQGAKASPTVYNMLVDEKIINGPKIKVTRSGRKGETEASAPEQPKL